jgi:hypothetical protein
MREFPASAAATTLEPPPRRRGLLTRLPPTGLPLTVSAFALSALALLILASPGAGVSRVEGDDDAQVGDWKRWKVDRDDQFEIGLRGEFQRVDGVVLGLEQTLKGKGDDPPRIDLAEAYAFNRQRWLYEATVEVPLPTPGPLRAGAGLFRLTRSFSGFDDRIITDVENSLGALLFKEDYRDYYEEEGFELRLEQPLWRYNAIEVGYLQSRHEVVYNSTRTSLTHWDEDFRPNPAAEAGDFRAFRLTASRDTRRGREGHPGTAHWYRVALERAGGGLGGDFNYSQLRADLRQYVKVSPGQSLSARLLYGDNFAGRLPVQKLFSLGGIGTLRGHDFKEFTGDQSLLGNLEYRFEVMSKFYSLAFVDLGATATGPEDITDREFALDGGFGLGTRNGRAEITVAKNLRDPDSPFLVGFRLGSMF